MENVGKITECKALTCYLNEHVYVMGLIQKDKGLIHYYLMSDKSAITEYCFGLRLTEHSEREYPDFAKLIERDYFPDYQELLEASEK